MDTSDVIQIAVGVVLTLTLGTVLWYACETRKQAKASTAMAKEMVEARHGQLLPVLDFVVDQSEQMAIEKVFAIKEGAFPETMRVSLKNIGLGPALDLKFQMKLDAIGPLWHTVGHLGVGELAKQQFGASEIWSLFLEPQDESVKRLSIDYSDAFGRRYRSQRDISFNQTSGGEAVGPLRRDIILR